jgi:hypothetical protein
LGQSGSGLLRELVPNAVKIAFLSNPTFPTAQTQLDDVHDGARTLGVEIDIVRAPRRPFEAFTTMSLRRPLG